MGAIKDKTMQFAVTWMNLEGIILNEIRKTDTKIVFPICRI